MTGAAKASEFLEAVVGRLGTSARSLLAEPCWARAERAAAAFSVDAAALIDAALQPKDARGANAADSDAADAAQAALASAVVSAARGPRIFLTPTMCHVLVLFAACARGSLPAPMEFMY